MIHVNPNILIWARETAGLTLKEAAKKLNVVEQSLKKIERGRKDPSHSMLLRMANKYRRPLVTFYLEDIPIESNYGVDFRGLSECSTPKDNAMINALLRYTKAGQQMIRAVLESEDESTPLPFVGWLRRKWNLPAKTELLNREFQRMAEDRRKLFIQDALHGLNMVLGDRCTHDKYSEQRDPISAFKLLRSSCEHSGIFVVVKSNLGSGHSKLSANLFRAFVIADDIAPFMVINKEDSIPARSFSVLHEIVHLLLDQTGISDFQHIDPIEKFCNKVAGEWLLPSRLIQGEEISLQADISDLKEIISQLSQQRNVSHTMVAMRLYHERVITKESFMKLEQYYTKEWEKSRQRKRETRKDKKVGGPSFYHVRRSELGDGLLRFVKRMIQSESLTVSKAAVILSAKPWQVSKLLESSN